MKTAIKIIAVLAACILACLLLCGCEGIRIGVRQYVLYDTIYRDYWDGDGWWTRDHAVVFDRGDAERWLDDFRTNERGEYSDTGPDDYPVVIKAANPAPKSRSIATAAESVPLNAGRRDMPVTSKCQHFRFVQWSSSPQWLRPARLASPSARPV